MVIKKTLPRIKPLDQVTDWKPRRFSETTTIQSLSQSQVSEQFLPSMSETTKRWPRIRTIGRKILKVPKAACSQMSQRWISTWTTIQEWPIPLTSQPLTTKQCWTTTFISTWTQSHNSTSMTETNQSSEQTQPLQPKSPQSELISVKICF